MPSKASTWLSWRVLEGDQQACGESIWVLLASSSFWLQVDPTWRLQDDQNHAPTIAETFLRVKGLPPGGGPYQGGGGGTRHHVYVCVYIYICVCI